MANTAPITLEQVFRFNRNEPHQLAAISQLEDDIRVNGYEAAMRRDRPWFATWSQAGKQADLSAALGLIKQFEGVSLRAYPDPLSGGDPWTIGYGTTRYQDGRSVRRGDSITPVEADTLLRLEVDRIAAALAKAIPFWSQMVDNQKCALISFAYNLGTGFYGSSGFNSITNALAGKHWGDIPKVLMLYVNPGTNVETGLRRRRTAEGKLWLS